MDDPLYFPPREVRGGVSVLHPISRSTLKRLNRHISQSVCSWNVKFSQALAAAAPFVARECISGKDAVTLARDILALDQDAFSAALRKSPMTRAVLRGLQRNAAVALGNVGTTDDVDVTRAHQDDEPLVHEHARWALTRRR